MHPNHLPRATSPHVGSRRADRVAAGAAELRPDLGRAMPRQVDAGSQRLADGRRRAIREPRGPHPGRLPRGARGLVDGCGGGHLRPGPTGLGRQRRDEGELPRPGATRRDAHAATPSSSPAAPGRPSSRPRSPTRRAGSSRGPPRRTCTETETRVRPGRSDGVTVVAVHEGGAVAPARPHPRHDRAAARLPPPRDRRPDPARSAATSSPARSARSSSAWAR